MSFGCSNDEEEAYYYWLENLTSTIEKYEEIGDYLIILLRDHDGKKRTLVLDLELKDWALSSKRINPVFQGDDGGKYRSSL